MTPKAGISAQRLARDFGTLLSEFTEQVDKLLTQPAPQSAVAIAEIRREVCIAVWAAITASFEASAMSREEKDRLAPLLREALIQFWQKHHASDPELAHRLAERATAYLEGRDPRSQVATATHIVERLLDGVGAEGGERRQLARQLVPLFAHRMLGDTYHINDLKTRFGIQLPAIFALFFTAGVAPAVEPALQALRLS